MREVLKLAGEGNLDYIVVEGSALLTIHTCVRPLGKAVAIFLIVIPVLLNLSKSLFTIHEVLRSSPIKIHSNPIHFI